jgi:hypothetical protein
VAHVGLRSAEQCCVSGLRNDHLPLAISHFKATLLLLRMILKRTWPSSLLICEMSASNFPSQKLVLLPRINAMCYGKIKLNCPTAFHLYYLSM